MAILGKPWPQVTAYAKVPASPKEAMALFTNFNSHKKIFPDIKESKIVSGPSQQSWQVDYVMALPWPLTDEPYKMKNDLKTIGSSQSSFQLDWSSVKTQQIKKIQGSVIFEQMGSYVCMTYSNIVDPGDTPGLSILKSLTVSKTKSAVLAFAQHVQKSMQLEQKGNLSSQVASFESSLQQSRGAPAATQVKPAETSVR